MVVSKEIIFCKTASDLQEPRTNAIATKMAVKHVCRTKPAIDFINLIEHPPLLIPEKNPFCFNNFKKKE